jgi:hypothetical protein
MINITIFSKNRAMQLEACLHSLNVYFSDLNLESNNRTVIYSADNSHKESYEVLKRTYDNFKFVEQNYFKQNSLVGINLNNPYTMFLVDDIIFKDNFSLNDSIFSLLKGNQTLLAISLRLHKGINYCYAIDKDIKIPSFIRNVPKEFCVWKWPQSEGDWGYAYSLDGNVYNTRQIVSILQDINYDNPNEMEAVLNIPKHDIQPIYMCCYETNSKLLNVPANRIQNQFKNRNEGSHEIDELLERFMGNERIDITKTSGMKNYSVHFPIEYSFVKR